jgi:hypothetical protein
VKPKPDIAGLAGLLFVGVSAHAAIQPVPRLDSASFTFLQRGTTNTLTLTGDGLSAVTDALPSHAGLRISPQPASAPSVVLEGSAGGISVRPTDPARSYGVQVIVAPDAPLGTHEVRVAGPGGVSNPLVIQVTDLPEIAEPTGTAQATSAPILAFPVGVSGRISNGAELDHYRFRARAGEEIAFDVQANRTGSPLDATLLILDAQGKELARSEDVHGLDPYLLFKAPADGEYVARINDVRYLGNDRSVYHLVAGARPYLESLFPFGGRRGSVVEVQLLGNRLEGADRLTLALAADAPLGRQELRARTAAGYSNPIGFEVGDLPELRESEPNNTPEKANAATGAVAINGRIEKAGDVDLFRFRSPSDQRWVVEVFARRFGSPLDALLTLQDAQGKVLQRNDDASGPDARIEFDAKKDTDYLLHLRDLTDRGGDRFGYRMVVRQPDVTPDFSARASAGRVRLHKGSWLAIRCEVARRNGYDGIVRVGGSALPPGVSVIPFTVGSGSDAGWILLGATEDAPGLNIPLRLNATGELGGRAVSREVQLAEAGWLTLLPPAPFSVDVGQASAAVVQNASVALDVAVVRQPGFDGEIKVIAEGPSGVNIPPLVLPSGKSRGQLPLNAAFNAATGTRPVMIRAESAVDGQTLVVAAPRLTDLTVQGIPVFATAMLPGSPFFRTDPVKLSAIALPTNSASAANRTEFVVKVERRSYEGEIILALEGIPAGVVATVQPIAAKAKEATVQLLVTEKAEAGKEHKIAVSTAFTDADRTWRQKTEPVSLTITAPAVETASTNAPATKPTP